MPWISKKQLDSIKHEEFTRGQGVDRTHDREDFLLLGKTRLLATLRTLFPDQVSRLNQLLPMGYEHTLQQWRAQQSPWGLLIGPVVDHPDEIILAELERMAHLQVARDTQKAERKKAKAELKILNDMRDCQ